MRYMHLRKRICQHFANDWSAKTGRTSNMVKYYPSKSVAWTRNVHLLSSDLSEARSATSEEVRVCGSYGTNRTSSDVRSSVAIGAKRKSSAPCEYFAF